MSDTTTLFRIPDMALHCVSGVEIDPADLRGQRVAIFFCPVEPSAAAREIESYRAIAEALAAEGVWLLGVLQSQVPPEAKSGAAATHLSLAEDLDGTAWPHFAPALSETDSPDDVDGAAFLFERWGTLRCAWIGSGHAGELLKAARERG